jgi:hypothetical protein
VTQGRSASRVFASVADLLCALCGPRFCRPEVNPLSAKGAKNTAKFAKKPGKGLLLGPLLRHPQNLPLAGLLDEGNDS